VDDGSGPLIEGVEEVAFRCGAFSVFSGVVEVSVGSHFIGVSVEVGNTSREGHFRKDRVDEVKWTEGNGVKEDDYQVDDAESEVGRDGREFDLWFIEVGKG
jgi:hypothetical protein